MKIVKSQNEEYLAIIEENFFTMYEDVSNKGDYKVVQKVDLPDNFLDNNKNLKLVVGDSGDLAYFDLVNDVKIIRINENLTADFNIKVRCYYKEVNYTYRSVEFPIDGDVRMQSKMPWYDTVSVSLDGYNVGLVLKNGDDSFILFKLVENIPYTQEITDVQKQTSSISANNNWLAKKSRSSIMVYCFDATLDVYKRAYSVVASGEHFFITDTGSLNFDFDDDSHKKSLAYLLHDGSLEIKRMVNMCYGG